MPTTQQANKEAIRNFYEEILNNRKFEELGSLISEEYIGAQGEKGVEGFQKQVFVLIDAFPDARWTVTELIAEGDKVVVKQLMEGTHSGKFRHIEPTNKAVTTQGTGFYEFGDGKIIRTEIQTDRLGFLQQLGVLPAGF